MRENAPPKSTTRIWGFNSLVFNADLKLRLMYMLSKLPTLSTYNPHGLNSDHSDLDNFFPSLFVILTPFPRVPRPALICIPFSRVFFFL